jgi:glutathione synthase/RimK-type ligase-like ATP-grasp enzyme
MAVILSSKFCLPSARELRDAIAEKSGITFPIVTEPTKKCKVLIRYGNCREYQNIVSDTQYNSPKFIETCYHKKRFSDLCLEHGFYAPNFSRDTSKLVFPAVIRDTLNSYGGKGINIARNLDEFNQLWKNYYWWTPYVSMKKEYRAVIVDGKLIKVFEKVLPDNYNEEFPIRNNEITHWSIRNVDKFKNLQVIAGKLGEILGKFFVGLDVGWTGDQYFIIEGNSAPGINGNTAMLLANSLDINYENYRTKQIN